MEGITIIFSSQNNQLLFFYVIVIFFLIYKNLNSNNSQSACRIFYLVDCFSFFFPYCLVDLWMYFVYFISFDFFTLFSASLETVNAFCVRPESIILFASTLMHNSRKRKRRVTFFSISFLFFWWRLCYWEADIWIRERDRESIAVSHASTITHVLCPLSLSLSALF